MLLACSTDNVLDHQSRPLNELYAALPTSPCPLTRLRPAGSSEGQPPGCEVKISRKTLSKAVGKLMKARDMKASRSSCTGHSSSLNI